LQLTQKTDFALRALVYLVLNPDHHVSIKEISESYQISYHHLVKALQELIQQGIIESRLGKGGGLKLKRSPSDVTIGEIVRITENHFNIFECFKEDNSNCIISPKCQLKGLMGQAQKAFLAVLDKKTLADVSSNGDQLQQLFN